MNLNDQLHDYWASNPNLKALRTKGEVTLVTSAGEAVTSLGGAGGAGGGSIVYTNAAGDFVATPTNGANTITITGLPFTLEAKHVIAGSIKKKNSSGEVSDVDLTSVSVSSGVITLAKELEVFTSTDELYVTLIGPDKWYDRAQDSAKHVVQNPDYAHYTEPEHIVDFDSTGASTIRKIIPFESYKNLSIHWKLATNNAADTTTLTFWATNNPDADNTADTDWVDVSTAILGAASKSATGLAGSEEDIAFMDTSKIAHNFMIKIVTVGTGNTNAADVYVKKA